MSETYDGETGELAEERHGALAVAEVQSGALMPVVTPDEAKAAMEAYLAICEAVLKPEDYQEFSQWDPAVKAKVKKKFKKKSAVKKLQTYWGITVTAPEAIRDDLGDGHFAFRVRGVARKGNREVEAWGACSTQEERFDLTQKDDESAAAFESRQRKALARSYHDVLSTAETRATNRAVMNVIGVGGGEVTADEMRHRDDDEPLPACPSCGKTDNVRKSQFDDGQPFYCWKKKGGCGAQFSAPTTPAGDRTAPREATPAKAQPAQAQAPRTAQSAPPPADAGSLFDGDPPAEPAPDDKAEKRALWKQLEAFDADTRIGPNERLKIYMDASGAANRKNLKSVDAAKRVIARYEDFVRGLDDAQDALDALMAKEVPL